jgi:hypothetical protein
MKHFRSLVTTTSSLTKRQIYDKRVQLQKALMYNRNQNMDLVLSPPQYPINIAIEQYGVLPMISFNKQYGSSVAKRLLDPLIEAEHNNDIFGVWLTDAKLFGNHPVDNLCKQLGLIGESWDIFSPNIISRPAIILIDDMFHMKLFDRLRFLDFLIKCTNANKGPLFVLCDHMSDKIIE